MLSYYLGVDNMLDSQRIYKDIINMIAMNAIGGVPSYSFEFGVVEACI